MGNKRGNGEGTITKRADGRWEARLSLPDGKRKCIYGKTRQEVARRMAEALRSVESGLPLADERQTVAQYLESWLEVAKHQVEPGTFRRYKNFVRIHIIPVLGRVVLSRLTAQQVQSLYAKALSKGLSTTTVHHLHGAFHRALGDALRLGLIQRNVTEMVRPPRRQHHEMMVLNKEQARSLLAVVAGDRFEAVYVLALSTGMREGEIFALHWRDVDLERAVLSVRGTIKEGEKGFFVGKTKTAYSRRRIDLSQNVVEALRRHRQRQDEEKNLLGGAWDSSQDLVFPNTVGSAMIPDNFVKRYFKRAAKLAGLPGELRFHDLRHTAATLLLSEGVNAKVVSEMLGHADVSITLRIYAHVLPSMQKQAAKIIDSLFQ
jgi:integrase